MKKRSFNGALLIEKLQHPKSKVYIPLLFRVQVRDRRQSPPQESRVESKWQELIKEIKLYIFKPDEKPLLYSFYVCQLENLM